MMYDFCRLLLCYVCTYDFSLSLFSGCHLPTYLTEKTSHTITHAKRNEPNHEENSRWLYSSLRKKGFGCLNLNNLHGAQFTISPTQWPKATAQTITNRCPCTIPYRWWVTGRSSIVWPSPQFSFSYYLLSKEMITAEGSAVPQILLQDEQQEQ